MANKLNTLNKTNRWNYITYLLVIIAYVILQVMSSTGSISSSLKGMLVPICAYVVMAVSLNLTVGVLGELSLGHAGFMSVGAFTGVTAAVSLQNLIPSAPLRLAVSMVVAALFAALAGFLIGIPVLRLKGDYLAIVTLGFGEIIRLVLENWTSVTKGSFGLSNISRPSLFGMEMGVTEATNYIYYIVLAAVVVTIIVVGRLKNSRIGLALQALREDEIACEAMGIDLTKVKLSAFALGSCWAGFAGVIFAAKTTFINPASFTFMESAMILSMVVLGGMGSVLGVTIAAAILVLAPEYLRAFSEYRMLLFGAVMVIMMIYRPQGLISGEKRTYKITNKDKIDSSKSAFDVPATGGQA